MTIAACGLAALAVAACGSRNSSELGVAVIGEPGTAEETTSQPALASKLWRASVAEGLVAFDEQGRVIPALADRWIVTDDGQSYIFRLRDGAWKDGDELTSASAKRSLEAALKALRSTPMGQDLSGIDEVREMAGRVIEIRLSRPMPYLLQLLAQPELGLYHEGEGAGPMSMEREGAIVHLTAIDPEQLGMPAIEDWAARTRRIDLRTLSGPEAVRSFNEGEVDLVLGGQIQDFPLTRSVGILRGTIQLDPVIGLFGLRIVSDKGFLAEPANREALAMAIDRGELLSSFGVGGWAPTTRLVTPSLDGDLGTIGERWGEQSLAERREVASARVRRWVAGKADDAAVVPSGRASAPPRGNAGSGEAAAEAPPPGAAPLGPPLKIWLPEGGGSDELFTRLSLDLATIGIVLDRVDDAASAELLMMDDVASYPRAAWYLNRLSCRAGRGLCSKEADALMAEARDALTAEERAALITEAEAELTAANVFIPFGTPIRWSLVRGSVDGFSTNSWGWHPLMPLAWLPK